MLQAERLAKLSGAGDQGRPRRENDRFWPKSIRTVCDSEDAASRPCVRVGILIMEEFESLDSAILVEHSSN